MAAIAGSARCVAAAARVAGHRGAGPARALSSSSGMGGGGGGDGDDRDGHNKDAAADDSLDLVPGGNVTAPLVKTDRRSYGYGARQKKTYISERILNFHRRMPLGVDMDGPLGFVDGTRIGIVEIPRSEDMWLTEGVLEAFERDVLLRDWQEDPDGHSKHLDNPEDEDEDEGSNHVPQPNPPQGSRLPEFGFRTAPAWEEAPEESLYDYIDKNRPRGMLVTPDEYNFRDRASEREKPHPYLAKFDKNADGIPRCDKSKRFHLVLEEHIDASNLPVIREFLNAAGMIEKRHKTRLCAKCQRKVARLVKRARQMGHIPYNHAFDVHNVIGFPDGDHISKIARSI